MEIEKLYKLLKENEDKEDVVKQRPYWKEMWLQHVKESTGYYGALSSKEAIARMISEKNYRERSHRVNCESLGVWIRVGDICFIDFGKGYLNEAGFQHFGLIMKIKSGKALVIPMTSNEKTYKEALKGNPYAPLLAIGKIEGMSKPSVLFLNDAKFINTARIIDVKAHIPMDSMLFQNIYMRFLKTVL